MEIIREIGYLIVAYLIGSIPTAVWVGKYFYNTDIRDHGSKNAGATNVLRVLGRKPAIFVFTVDVLKGFIPVYFFPILLNEIPETETYILWQIAIGAWVVIGHIFPIFAQFKGGKGVATLLGITIGIVPLAALICFLFFLLILLSTRIVSLSSILTAFFFCFYIFFIAVTTLVALQIFAVFATILLLFTHRKNIKRIINKEEPKIKF